MVGAEAADRPAGSPRTEDYPRLHARALVHLPVLASLTINCVRHPLHFMKNKDVLISGAGIAGPALAYWLSGHGFATTVVERAPAPRAGGQTVDLRGAGRTVIERMGLMDRVREVSVSQRGIAFVGADGRIAARMPTELFGGEGIVSEVEALRGDLGRVLYEATVPATEYLFDDTV